MNLTQEQKNKINELYRSGLFTRQKIAKKVGVDEFSVLEVVDPEKAEKEKLIMKNTSFKKFEANLHKLVKMDYGFELYNYNEFFISFSFFHLNSMYNAFCNYNMDTNSLYFNWQYANKNKKVAKIASDIMYFIHNYYEKFHNYDKIVETVDYYNSLAVKVFEAKYSIDVSLRCAI